MTASPLATRLIAEGLNRPASADPLGDALGAVSAATAAIEAAIRFPPGVQRNARLSDAALHIEGARHYLAAERVRSGRS